MKYTIYIVILLLLPVAFAENIILNTDFDLKITPYNITQCYVEITTEGDDFDYNVSSDSTYNNEEIKFIRDVKCKEELYFENMSNLCIDITRQYSTLMDNMNYIEKYENCNVKVHSLVDTEEHYKGLYNNMSSKYDSCLSAKEGMLSKSDCDDKIVSARTDAKTGMISQGDCNADVTEAKNELNIGHALIAIGVGAVAMFYWEKRKREQAVLRKEHESKPLKFKLPKEFLKR